MSTANVSSRKTIRARRLARAVSEALESRCLLTASLSADPTGYEILFTAQDVPQNTTLPLYVNLWRADESTYTSGEIPQGLNYLSLDAVRPGISWTAQLLDGNGEPLTDPSPVKTLRFGDADGNSIVDSSDVRVVNDNTGTGTTWSQGDFDDDGDVDQADLDIVNVAIGADTATVDFDLPASNAMSAPVHSILSYSHDIDVPDYWEINCDDGTSPVLMLHENLTPVLAHTFEQTGTFDVSVTAHDADGAHTRTETITVTAAPAVFHDEYGPHKLEWLFNQNYYDTLDPSDLWVTNLTTGEVFDTALTAGPGNHATFTFPTAVSNGRNGVLPDGNYQAIINADGVRGLGTDQLVSFFVHTADFNHDRVVDEADADIWMANRTGSRNFGYPPTNPLKTFRQGDADYDGDVDGNDFGLYAARYHDRMLVPPPAPNGLTVVSTTDPRSIRLEWQMPEWSVDDETTGIQGYTVYASEDGGPFSVWDSVSDSLSMESVALQLSHGVSFKFYVRAYSDAGESVVSNTVSAATPLPAPTNLALDYIGDTEAGFKFRDNSIGEAGFELEMTSSGGTVAQTFPPFSGSTQTRAGSISGLSASTTYQYRLRAYTKSATSAWTAYGTLTTAPPGTPTTPTGLNSAFLINSFIKLTWNDNSNDEVRFEVERSLDGGVSYAWFRTVDGGSGSTKTTTIDWVDQRVAAYFRVVAVGSLGQPALSNILPVAVQRGEYVEVTATADSTIGSEKIILDWEQLVPARTTFYVYRADAPSDGWGTPIATLSDSTTFTDTDVEPGGRYYYRVSTGEALNLRPQSGYVTASIKAPASLSRGKIVLVMALDSLQAGVLASEIARLKQDLVGDGWEVLIIDDVTASTPVEEVRNKILAKVWIDPVLRTGRDYAVKQVMLLGHVPIPYAGGPTQGISTNNPDRHGARALPCDQFYGDIDGVVGNNPGDAWSDNINFPTALQNGNPATPWPNVNQNAQGDGKFDFADYAGNRAPELAVGRVDMSGLAGGFVESEAELLARYLARDHKYRQGITSIDRIDKRAFSVDHLGDYGQWHYLSALVGPDQVDSGDWTVLYDSAQAYQWAYIGGAGLSNAVITTNASQRPVLHAHAVGIPGLQQQHDLTDPNNHYQSVFNVFYGSYFVDWTYGLSLLRSLLANDGRALTAAWGTDRFNFSTAGSGETIGAAALSSQAHSNFWHTIGAAYSSLLGDPTLRQDVVQPVSDVVATPTASGVTLTWTASPDASDGYRILRALADGATPLEDLVFTEVGTGTAGLTLEDTDATAAGTYVYMVRAQKSEDGPSGSYYNLSQGTFAVAVVGSSGNDSSTVTSDPPAGVVTINGFSLSPSNLTSITIDGNTGDDTVEINGDAGASGVLNLNVGGAGVTANSLNVVSANVVINETQHLTSISIAGDKATVASGGDKVLVTDSLSISSGTLDLKDNQLIVMDGGVAAIRTLIIAGYGSGGWNGTSGITGTGVAPPEKTMLLGYAQGDDPRISGLGGQLGGEGFDSNSALVRFTYQADADLDGDVDGVDISVWSSNFTGSGGSSTKLWTQGDWDYDGDVDGAEALYWSRNYTGSGG